MLLLITSPRLVKAATDAGEKDVFAAGAIRGCWAAGSAEVLCANRAFSRIVSNLNDATDGVGALQQAVKLSPTDAFSYSNLGIVYYQLNQYENAIDALNSAKALDPNDAKTHNYLGCACSQKGWQEVAEKEFRKAIEIDPNFGDAHFNLALVYATSKPPSLELARREYNRALELGIAKDARLEKLLAGPQP